MKSGRLFLIFLSSASKFCLIEFCGMQVANAIFVMPRAEGDTNPVIQAMLQGLSWCEKHSQADLASRNAYIKAQGKASIAALTMAMDASLTRDSVIVSNNGPLRCRSDLSLL